MLKILQISDLHILPKKNATLQNVDTDRTLQRVLDHARRLHGFFDLVIVSGDLADTPCEKSYRRVLQHLSAYGDKAVCLPGNHDDFALMQTVLNTEKVGCQRLLQLQNWQIICLNSRIPGSHAGLLDNEELSFLENSLQNHPNGPSLIAVHHHCIETGSGWLDEMRLMNREALMDILAGPFQATAVTCGHVHQETAATRQGVAFFSAPATCFQFKPFSEVFGVDHTPPGYRIFELYPDGNLQTACYYLPEQYPVENQDGTGSFSG